ncbi:sensor histidine kinase [Methanogenium sp. S4BF]|uniref:sensor histidine kinase n=1 Tax=Methanogenium sp. S4BF TaxID=1789226 RepID=UPI0024169CC2|nr:sensor histidine kinase [Methanogenium sp. S4BF]WFN34442.1 sensor histidine kinase [Methanogenium sp. S4BF]
MNQLRHLSPWMRRGVPVILVILMLCSAGAAAPPVSCDVQKSDHILIIHSYGPDMDWVGAVTDGLARVFPADDPDIVIYTEYMDGKLVSDSRHYENLAAVYRHKYASIPIDLILVSDDDAYAFILEYGDELFPGVPIVFFGVSGYDPAHREELPNLTGVVERTRVGPTVDLITTLQPGVQEVYVVNDPGTTTGRFFAAELVVKAAAYNGTPAFRAHGETDMTVLCHDLQNLTPGTAVLLMDFNRDSDGRMYRDGEIACIVSAWSPVPVYGISDTFLGHGVVGGCFTDTTIQAESAAKMGADILNGTPAGEIPVSAPPEGQVFVDYMEMQKHGLSVALLPEGAVAINQPDGEIVLPDWMLGVLIVGGGALIAVVLVLVSSNQRIRKTKQDLHTSNQKLKTLFSVTRHDVNNQVMAASGYLELLSDDVTVPGVQPFIQHIRKALQNIEEQIAFARDYEKAGASHPVWQNPAEIAEQMAARQHAVSVDVALSGIEIYADPMLEKVFANLFDNAARHGEHATRVQVTASLRGDAQVIVVGDNGAGVPDEKKRFIFERGYGANTGYGLFLASDILAVTGLTITETGTYGTGARFEITVPKGRWRVSR